MQPHIAQAWLIQPTVANPCIVSSLHRPAVHVISTVLVSPPVVTNSCAINGRDFIHHYFSVVSFSAALAHTNAHHSIDPIRNIIPSSTVISTPQEQRVHVHTRTHFSRPTTSLLCLLMTGCSWANRQINEWSDLWCLADIILTDTVKRSLIFSWNKFAANHSLIRPCLKNGLHWSVDLGLPIMN